MLPLNFRAKPIVHALLLLFILNQNVNADESPNILNKRFIAAQITEQSNPNAALTMYQDLVDQGHTEAKVRLAALLFSGLGDKSSDKENAQQGLRLLHEAAALGSSNAYYGLSVMYHDGTLIPPNADLGMKWLLKAAEAGEIRAQNQLGSLYLDGVFVEKHIKKAMYWYKEAVKQNYNSARYNLANIYLEHLNTSKENTQKAVALYLVAANAGHSNSKVALGNIFLEDTYNLKDGNKAFYWLNAAAQDGNTYGQTGLASCYRYGIGTQVDYKKALHWYQRSVDATQSPIPRYRLAEMTMLGLGTEVDLDRARKMFLSLSQEGYEDGTTAVTQIDELLVKAKSVRSK